MNRDHLTALAAELGMKPQFLVQLAADLARGLPGALEQAVKETKPLLAYSAKIMAERLQQFVLSTTRKMAARLTV
jgi:hypothetical protein